MRAGPRQRAPEPHPAPTLRDCAWIATATTLAAIAGAAIAKVFA